MNEPEYWSEDRLVQLMAYRNGAVLVNEIRACYAKIAALKNEIANTKPLVARQASTNKS